MSSLNMGSYQAPQISGSLPWGGGGGGIGVGGAVGQAYAGAYNSALQMNQSNYNNIMTGYQQALASQTSAQQAIGAGYTGLYNNVLGQIQNTFGAQSTAINQASQREAATGSQNLINSGLGNSTIMQSMNMGVESQRQQQQTNLTDQQAQMMGSYMSSLGQAGLQNQQQGANNIAQTTQNQLGFMNSVNAQYPNAGLYAQLAQQQAQAKYGYGGGSFAGAGQAGPKVGYVPSGTPGQPSSGGYGDSGAGGGLAAPAGATTGSTYGTDSGWYNSSGDSGGGGDFSSFQPGVDSEDMYG